MKTIKKQVMQEKTFFVAKDGKEFDNEFDCGHHEYELAFDDACKKFDFTYKNNDYAYDFTAVYREEFKAEFAEDLSVIIKARWDVDSTNMYEDYTPDTILETFEKELGCKFIDGHKYSFEGYLSYTDADHADDFYMEIEDVTEGDAAEKQYRECKEALLENKPAYEFIENAKRQVGNFGKVIVKQILDDLTSDICSK